MSEELTDYSIHIGIYFRILEHASWLDRWDEWLEVQMKGYFVPAALHRADLPWLERYAASRMFRKLHTMRVIYGVGACAILTALFMLVVGRSVSRDIAFYAAQIDDLGGFGEESEGWKRVSTEVFRKPPHFTLISSAVGNSVQLLFMGIGVFLLVISKVLDPRVAKADLLAVATVFWALLGFIAGYVSGWFYDSFQRTRNWQLTAIRTCVVYAAGVWITWIILNESLRAMGSSAAQPRASLAELFLLWLLLMNPLIWMGTRVGRSAAKLTFPVQPTVIPRTFPISRLQKLRRWWIPLNLGLLPFIGVLPMVVEMMELSAEGRVFPTLSLGFASTALLLLLSVQASVLTTYLILRR